MSDIAKEFGKEIRKQREKLGLSQEAFAEKAGIHRTYVSSIELGKVEISIKIGNKLAVALNKKFSSLIKEINL